MKDFAYDLSSRNKFVSAQAVLKLMPQTLKDAAACVANVAS